MCPTTFTENHILGINQQVLNNHVDIFMQMDFIFPSSAFPSDYLLEKRIKLSSDLMLFCSTHSQNVSNFTTNNLSTFLNINAVKLILTCEANIYRHTA